MARRAAWVGGEKIPSVVYIYIGGNVLWNVTSAKKTGANFLSRSEHVFFPPLLFILLSQDCLIATFKYCQTLPPPYTRTQTYTHTHIHTHTHRMTGYATKPRNFVNWLHAPTQRGKNFTARFIVIIIARILNGIPSTLLAFGGGPSSP